MTAYAMIYTRERITIASDSLGYLPDKVEVRPFGFMSKVLPLQHLKAVLFSRGQQQITVNVMAQLLLLPQMQDIETAAEALPGMLRSVTREYCQRMGIEDPGSLNMLDVIFCGWSEAKGRMRLWHMVNLDGYAPDVGVEDHYGVHSIPAMPAEFHPTVAPDISADDFCIAIVKAIGRSFASDPACSSLRIGGEVVATEVTRSGISQRVIHRFENYEEDRRAGAAVVARALRGDLDPGEAVREGLFRVAPAEVALVREPPARTGGATVHAMVPRQDNDVRVPAMNRHERRRQARQAAKAR